MLFIYVLKIKSIPLTFTAVLFTISKTWNQPKCPLTDEWIKTQYLCKTEYYSAIIEERDNATVCNMDATGDYHTE